MVKNKINKDQEEYQLQNVSFAPGENEYLNEFFSEELSDGGERDEFIQKQKEGDRTS